MTTSLFSILTAGSDRMLQTDPHGWTLTLISVGVVFIALVILYFIYNFSGSIFSGKISFKRKPKAPKGAPDADADVAAAIALALQAECGSDDEIAAVTALYLYLNDNVHDVESGVITIRHNAASAWNGAQFNFRKQIRK